MKSTHAIWDAFQHNSLLIHFLFFMSFKKCTTRGHVVDRNVHGEGRYLTGSVLFPWRLCHQTWTLKHCDIVLRVQEACNWHVTEISRYVNADSTLFFVMISFHLSGNNEKCYSILPQGVREKNTFPYHPFRFLACLYWCCYQKKWVVVILISLQHGSSENPPTSFVLTREEEEAPCPFWALWTGWPWSLWERKTSLLLTSQDYSPGDSPPGTPPASPQASVWQTFPEEDSDSPQFRRRAHTFSHPPSITKRKLNLQDGRAHGMRSPLLRQSSSEQCRWV